MALLHRDHDHEVTERSEVPDHPPPEWTTTTATTTAEPAVVRRGTMGQTVRTVVVTVCVLAIAAFLVLNTDDTEIDLGFDTFTSPLWVTTGVAALVGVVLGFALGHRRRID